MPINVIDEKTGEVIAGPGKKKKPKSWITKKKKTPDNPRLKGGYDPQKQQDPKWITKKKPTNWITKKKKPTEWIKRKPPTDIRKKLTDAFAGGVKGKPHSSPEGQAASAGRTIKRIGQERQQKFQGGGRTRLLEELGRVEAEPSNRNRRAEISRVHGELNRGYKGGGRTKKFAGGPIIKKIINKLKPKGVFKPKPGAVKDVNVDKLLKNLGDEIKAAPLPPQLKKSLDKLKRAYPHKKASGGRIGLRHGGSAGAAKRGHGAEIK